MGYSLTGESISNRGLANEVDGLSFSSAVEITETEDANGLPILDQGKDRPNQPPVLNALEEWRN